MNIIKERDPAMWEHLKESWIKDIEDDISKEIEKDMKKDMYEHRNPQAN